MIDLATIIMVVMTIADIVVYAIVNGHGGDYNGCHGACGDMLAL